MKKNLISETIYKEPDHASHNNNNIHNANNHYTQGNDKQQHHTHYQLRDQTASFSGHYNVNIRFDPITPENERLTELILSITDQRLG